MERPCREPDVFRELGGGPCCGEQEGVTMVYLFIVYIVYLMLLLDNMFFSNLWRRCSILGLWTSTSRHGSIGSQATDAGAPASHRARGPGEAEKPCGYWEK